MRTTVTLDADVETLLRKAIRQRGKPFKQVLNDAVRTGLRASPPGAHKPFRQPTFDLGPPRVDLDQALTLAQELEDQASLTKLIAGR